MKKLMILALVAGATVCANAASIKWTVSAISALPDGTAASTAMTAYWLEGSKWDAFNALEKDAIAAYARENGTKGTTTSNMRGTSAAGTFGSYLADQDVSGFFVVLSTDANDANYYAASSELYEATVPGTGSNLTPSFVFDTASTGWQTVPEPTSGLLLLLGVAGLALRRRRA